MFEDLFAYGLADKYRPTYVRNYKDKNDKIRAGTINKGMKKPAAQYTSGYY